MVRACFVAGRLTGANPGGPRWALAMGTGSLQGTPERRPWKGEPEGPGPAPAFDDERGHHDGPSPAAGVKLVGPSPLRLEVRLESGARLGPA